MNEFLNTNKKYIILLVLGMVLLIMPGIMDNSFTVDNNCEKEFISVMQNAKGVGKIEIMTGRTENGEISGVVIVAQGAENISIRKQIADAACAAFDVQPHKIQIFSYNREADLSEIK